MVSPDDHCLSKVGGKFGDFTNALQYLPKNRQEYLDFTASPWKRRTLTIKRKQVTQNLTREQSEYQHQPSCLSEYQELHKSLVRQGYIIVEQHVHVALSEICG